MSEAKIISDKQGWKPLIDANHHGSRCKELDDAATHDTTSSIEFEDGFLVVKGQAPGEGAWILSHCPFCGLRLALREGQSMNTLVLACGHPFDGMTLYGPYADEEEGAQDGERFQVGTWEVVELHHPKEP